jgi:hypothetical protein
MLATEKGAYQQYLFFILFSRVNLSYEFHQLFLLIFWLHIYALFEYVEMFSFELFGPDVLKQIHWIIFLGELQILFCEGLYNGREILMVPALQLRVSV